MDILNKDAKTEVWDDVTDNIDSEEELNEFIEQNIIKQYKSFSQYFNEYVAVHSLDLPEVMRKSNIDKGYFYNIINGDKKPRRDKIICVCIGAGMDLKHLNRGLRIAKYSKIDPKDERDLRIKYEVNKGVDNVIDVNLKLDEYGLELLK